MKIEEKNIHTFCCPQINDLYNNKKKERKAEQEKTLKLKQSVLQDFWVLCLIFRFVKKGASVLFHRRRHSN